MLYVINDLKKIRFSIYSSQFVVYFSGLLLSCKDGHEIVWLMRLCVNAV